MNNVEKKRLELVKLLIKGKLKHKNHLLNDNTSKNTLSSSFLNISHIYGRYGYQRFEFK